MIARGDLAIQVGSENVPVLQKDIIHKCRIVSKPVIVATQMLESMMHDLVPTRAEASDVSNAVYDTVDAVMLSGETAMGKYPIKTVAMMSKIISATEQVKQEHSLVSRYSRRVEVLSQDISKMLTYSAQQLAQNINAQMIVVFSETGYTVRSLSATRPLEPIVVRSSSPVVLNQASLLYGTIPDVNLVDVREQKKAIEGMSAFLKKNKFSKKGDVVVVISGFLFGKPGSSNTVSVVILD